MLKASLENDSDVVGKHGGDVKIRFGAVVVALMIKETS